MTASDDADACGPANADQRQLVSRDPWQSLRQFTSARIALGRSGSSLSTRDLLDFGLAHAQARDAVHLPLDVATLQSQLQADGWDVIALGSRAADRAAYLARPDWGRRLREDARPLLDAARAAASARVDADGSTFDLVFVVSDGLSSTAVQRHAAPLLQLLRPLRDGLRVAPIVVATQARVALSDEVGQCLQARIAISLIGERPGLSSPGSLGAYLTYAPRVGNTDEARNCISNIRPQGLVLAEAAQQIAALLRAALHAQRSGVALRYDPHATGAIYQQV